MIDKDLFRLLGKNKKYIFIVVFLMVVGLIANITFYGGIALGVNELLNNRTNVNFNNFILPIIMIVCSIIVRYISSRASGEVKDILGRKVKKELRGKIYNKILSLGCKHLDDINMAGLTQISMEGIEQLDIYYSTYLPQFFYAMIAPFILFAVCVFFDWRASLALICLVPFIPASIIAVSKYAKKVFAKYWGKYISMGDYFLDATSGLKELKIFNYDKEKHEEMNAHSEEFRKITMKVLIMQLASTTIMDTIAYGGAGLGIALTLIGLNNGWVNNVAISLFIIFMAVDFFLPMRQFGSAFHVGMNGASAGKKILNLLNEKELDFGDDKVTEPSITFKDVTFSYDGKRNILNNVNMEFKKNSLTSIVGESGSGKSTIANLIIGSLKVGEGTILVGDKPLYSLSRVRYYGTLGVVSYNTYIFNESIRENFRLAKVDITDEEIYHYLKLVNLDEFVRNNGGLDKVILEEGNNISGGQKQRLVLAINLSSNKDIYIFDEATSNIDVDSETIIMNNIKEMSKTHTIILISHRLENVVTSDNIYYLENGEIKESGTHVELMSLNKEYAALYNKQKSLECGYKEGLGYGKN